MSSLIIDLNDWNVQGTHCLLMKGSKNMNCSVSNAVTKKSYLIKTPMFQTKYSIDDKYSAIKMKIHSDEIPFEKFIECDDFVRSMDKSAIFLTERKKKSIYSPLVSEDGSYMSFHCRVSDIKVVDELDNPLLHTDITSLKTLLPPSSDIICYIKFDYFYNNNIIYGIMKSITKIQKV